LADSQASNTRGAPASAPSMSCTVSARLTFHLRNCSVCSAISFWKLAQSWPGCGCATCFSPPAVEDIHGLRSGVCAGDEGIAPAPRAAAPSRPKRRRVKGGVIMEFPTAEAAFSQSVCLVK
jgi:hypothetical protein